MEDEELLPESEEAPDDVMTQRYVVMLDMQPVNQQCAALDGRNEKVRFRREWHALLQERLFALMGGERFAWRCRQLGTNTKKHYFMFGSHKAELLHLLQDTEFRCIALSEASIGEMEMALSPIPPEWREHAARHDCDWFLYMRWRYAQRVLGLVQSRQNM